MTSRFVDFNSEARGVNRRSFFGVFVATLLAAGSIGPLQGAGPSPAAPGTPKITVVDIIPEALSGETANDSEPNVAVNPQDASQIAASALTRDPMGAKTAPIFISTDGGQNWSCRSVVPSSFATCDITLRFGSNSSVLYVSALRNQVLMGNARAQPYELMICQTSAFASARVMDQLFTRQGEGIDQPYIAAITHNQKDRVFVGDYDGNAPDGHTATINRSFDAVHGGFEPSYIEVRPTDGGDSSEIRPAISGDGNVVYAVFNRVTKDCGITRISDVVVVRDDNGGNSAQPFTSLIDPDDNLPGKRAVKDRTFAWNQCLGRDRLGGDLAIAVHPSKPNTVYMVWTDWINGHTTLHMKCSIDGGKTWSKKSLKDVPDAKNPGLAVNAEGMVGFLYQQVTKMPEGDVWFTQFEQTTDDFKTPVKPMTLAKFPVAELPDCPNPEEGGDNLYLGDYLHLMSVGKNFYGIFAARNLPDMSRFPYHTTFQRLNKNGKLVDDKGNEVTPSIDPFFFEVTE